MLHSCFDDRLLKFVKFPAIEFVRSWIELEMKIAGNTGFLP
jgi:hypothetical protein